MDESQRARYLRQALHLAARGEGWTAPNPRVGALLVHNGRIIGRGWHHRYGGPHAEVEAIADAARHGQSTAGATLFVTLEPCCHHGKTPPCTQAVLAAGITHVEVATPDEFPTVAGQGIKFLQEHGLTVNVGCCQKAARRLNAGFFLRQRLHRPQVILKWAQSLDAKLDCPPPSPSTSHARRLPDLPAPSATPPRRWITGEKARRHAHQVRSHCGALVIGVQTVLADDPELTVRLPGRHYQPRRAVLDSRLRIPANCRLLRTAAQSPVLLYTLADTLDRQTLKVQELRDCGAEVLGVKELTGRVDLHEVIQDLSRRGVNDVLVEGGPTVLASFWQAGLADKVMAYIAPCLIGGGAPALAFDWTERRPVEVAGRPLGDDLLIEAFFTQP